MQRPILKQEATAFAFTVPVAPAAPLAPQWGLTALYDTFVITVPSTAANSVFMGFDAGVIVGTGIELLASTTTQFKVDHDGRQLYELQNLLKRLTDYETCISQPMEFIPFVVWDMSQIYVVAAAATAITVAAFKAVYI